jgi:hypothetical protein
VSEATDSNLYRIPYNAAALGIALPSGYSRSDRITDVGVGLDTDFNPAHQAISLHGEIENVRFDRNTYLDHVAGSGALTWDWQSGATLTGELSTALQRSLARFVNSRIFSKDLIDRTTNSSSVRWAFGADLAVRLVADFAAASHEAEFEKYQNNRKSSGTAALEYLLSDGDTIGLNYRQARATFRDDLLTYLDKWTYLSLSDSLGVKTRLTVDVGWHERSNVRLARAAFSGSVGHAFVIWQLTPITEATLKGWRELNAYIDNESDYYVSNGVSLALSWKPNENVRVTVNGSLDHQNYIGSGLGILATVRQDKVSAADISARWTPRQWLEVILMGGVERRSSSDAYFMYLDRIASAKLRLIW